VYRGQYSYNLLDTNLRAFAAEVPQVNQWDDHEVRNNAGQIIDHPRYTEHRLDVLAVRANQAFPELRRTRFNGDESAVGSESSLRRNILVDKATYLGSQGHAVGRS
jgi:phosphodiesterase/alkaline phosphatase D-like protein